MVIGGEGKFERTESYRRQVNGARVENNAGFTTLDLNLMKVQQFESEQFNDRIIFMSMYNDI